MVWGQTGSRGIDDLVKRIAANDPKLQSLTILRQRRFNHDDVASLVHAMASNTHLTELYASSHPLAPHTAALLSDMLAASGSLRALCVGDSSLGDDGVAALVRGVASSSSLTRLDLTGKGLGPRGAAALASALATAAPLSHLILSSNAQLGDSGLAALCNGAECEAASTSGAPAPSLWAGLATLELQGCGVGAAGVRALAGSPNCGRLQVLRLDGNPLGAAGGEALRELLQSATQLRELHLRGTELGDEGGEALAAGLAACTGTCTGTGSAADRGGAQLHLDLGDCGLGSRTMAALEAAFAAGAMLGSLSLAGNTAVSDTDVEGLGSTLRRREAAMLPHLDLSGTQAGPRAVQALSRVPGLRHVSLVGCPLNAAGAAALASSLSAGGWAELQELCVSGTGLAAVDAEAVFGALTEGAAPKLKSLEIGANPATQDDSFHGLLEKLRLARPDVAVYWRSGDDPVPVMQ